jgi:hypothetical protein
MKEYNFSKAEECLQFLKDIHEDHAIATLWATALCMRTYVSSNKDKIFKAAFISSPEFYQVTEDIQHLLF